MKFHEPKELRQQIIFHGLAQKFLLHAHAPLPRAGQTTSRQNDCCQHLDHARHRPKKFVMLRVSYGSNREQKIRKLSDQARKLLSYFVHFRNNNDLFDLEIRWTLAVGLGFEVHASSPRVVDASGNGGPKFSVITIKERSPLWSLRVERLGTQPSFTCSTNSVRGGIEHKLVMEHSPVLLNTGPT